MEKFDFETVPYRTKTDSVKWNIKKDQLPMWIADMDFKTAPAIIDAMKEKIELGAFGYEWPGDDYFDSVSYWLKSQHNVQADKKWMIFTTGVVPAISSIVRHVSNIGDNVLVQEPVYNIFYNSIENNGRHVLSNDLEFDGSNYHINWDDLEEKLANPLTTLMIFCNPHNPIGKVWSKQEVEKIANLCHEYNVVLLSDEIHGDLVRQGFDYTPSFSVTDDENKKIISLISPSKTFNVAALHAATAIIPNETLRNIVNRDLNSDEVAEPNLLAIPATIAAYKQGESWLAALKQQLRENFEYVADFIKQNISDIKVVSGNATYLMWLDVEAFCDNSDQLQKFLVDKTGLILSSGSVYRGNGNQFLRMNLACPLDLVKDGMKRLQKGIKLYRKTI